MSELTKEYFEELLERKLQESKDHLENRITKLEHVFDKKLANLEGYLEGMIDEKLKPFATKYDLEQGLEKLAQMTNKGFEGHPFRWSK